MARKTAKEVVTEKAAAKSRTKKSGAKATPGPLVQLIALKVKLYSRKSIWRTLQFRGDQTLDDLHIAIFEVFDRFDPHLYEFQFGKKPMDRNAVRYVDPMINDDPFGFGNDDDAPSADQAILASLGLFVGQKFFYWFDFGDSWWHEIEVVSIAPELAEGEYPKLLKSAGESPPQYPDEDEEDDDDSDED